MLRVGPMNKRRMERQNLSIAIAGGLMIIVALSLIVGTFTGSSATESVSQEFGIAQTAEGVPGGGSYLAP
jgi:hypothetical protein